VRPSSPVARTSSSTTPASAGRDPQSGLPLVALGQLPREAQQTVALIDAGGPFPYSQDGVTFGNNERILPAHPRGWYREYTVRTPGEGDRGPRRIVTGDHDTQLFYTGDHYASFVRVSR
jgi:ribonuclease T1